MVRLLRFFAILSIFVILAGCSTSSDEDESLLCRSTQVDLGDTGSLDPGNTREFDDHSPIKTPKIAWEYEATSLPDNPRSLAVFHHMIGLLRDERGAMTVEFIDGLLGTVIRNDPVPNDTKLVEVVGSNMFIVTGSNELHRVDLGTGQLVWTLEFVDSIAFAPVVIDDVLYITSGISTGEQGYVYAIELESGRDLWASPIPPLDGQVYPILSSNLLVTDNAVIANGFGFLYAFDRVTGELCWDTDASKYGLAQPHNVPVSNPKLVLFESDGRLLGLNKFDGDIVWSVDKVRRATNIAASDETAVVVDENNNLKAVNTADGKQIWLQTGADYGWSRMIVAGDTVYATTQDGFLVAHDLVDGAVNWELRIGEVGTQMYATENRLYVLADGVLICITD